MRSRPSSRLGWIARGVLLLGVLAARPAPPAARIADQVDRHLAAVRDRAARVEALADLYALRALRARVSDPSAIDRRIDELARGARHHPLLRDHARALAAQGARRAGDDARARQLLAATGLVTEFWLLGPLDNTGGGGLGDETVDVARLDLGEAHAGQGGAVTWRRVRGGAEQGYLDLGAQLDPAEQVSALLLFEIVATRPTELALRAGSNDQLCLRAGALPRRCFDQRHGWGFEQHALGLRVPAGRTPVLVQLGSLRPEFRASLRLTALDGGPLSSDVRTALPEAGAVLRFEQAAVQARPALDLVEHLRARATASAGSRQAAAWIDLALVLEGCGAFDEREDPTAAATAWRQALALRPDDAWLWLRLGQALVLHDDNAARDAYQRAVALQPAFGPALRALGEHRLARLLDHEALPLLQRAQQLEPEDPETVLALAAALHGQQLDGDDARALVEDYARAHGAMTTGPRALAVARRWLHDLVETDRQVEARALAERLLAVDATDDAALRVRIEQAERDGDLAALEALLERQAAMHPQHAGPRLRLARRLAWGGQPQRAIALLTPLGAVFPDATEVLESLGEAQLLAGAPQAAVATWQRSLALRPQQPELRRRVQDLATASDSSLPPVDAAALRALVVPDSARPFGVVVLQHRSHTRMFANGLYRTEEEIALKLLDAGHAKSLRLQSVPYSPGREIASVLLAERIDGQGRSLPPDQVRESGSEGRSGGVYSDRHALQVQFGPLEAGDIVRVRSRVEAVGEVNLFGDFYGQILPAQGPWPVLRFEHVVEAPAGRPLYVNSQGLRHSVEDLEDATVRHRFEATNLPGHLAEPMMPPWIERVPWLSVSTYRSWDELSRWYARLIAEQYALDQDTRQVAQALVAGVPADDPRERVRRVHDHVVKKTRYVGIELGIHGWKPYRASLVHRRGYGDCKDKATLLVAMLGEVGVEAQLVLVRTVQLGELAPDPATMWAFNHAIAYVPALELYLDGTAEFSGLDELPSMDQGAMALRVSRDGRGELVRIPLQPAARNLNTSDYRIAIDDEGSAQLQGIERFWGSRAARLRQQYQDPATRHEQLEREVSEGFAGAQVRSVEFGPLDDLNAEVWYRFEATLPGRAQPVDGGWRLPISLYPHGLASAYAASPQRLSDVVLDHPWRTRNVMRYQLPPSMRPRRLPPPLRIATPHLLFEQRIEPTEDGVVVDELTELPSRRVPLADYAAFREACLAADAAMQQRLELEPVAGVGGGAP